MIRVVIADDSPLVRAVLRDILTTGGDITVAGEAANGREAAELTERHRPDLVVMDLVMPIMDGLEAIGEIMAHCPTPILVLSGSLDDREVGLAFTAIKLGALDAMAKPGVDLAAAGAPFADTLREAVRLLSRVKVIRHHLRPKRVPLRDAPPASVPPARRSVLAIGASTGGPKAVMSIVKALPANFPGTVCIVQHIAAGFARGFAQWLDRECRMTVRLARDGDELTPGVAFVAPDEHHMTVSGGVIRLDTGPPVNCCRPAIDPLFRSLAEERGSEVVGVLLTGMGRDGAEGLRLIRQSGGMTVVQDEESSVIFGMPRAAIALDAADRVAPIGAIPTIITDTFTRQGGESVDKLKILVVDDSELVLAMARDALEEAGFEVVTAANGIEANSHIFSRNKPDLIILDVMLPMLDGNKKAKLLKEKDFSREIPIVLLSSKSEEELKRLVQESGGDAYIRKPFTPWQLVTTIRKVLEERKG